MRLRGGTGLYTRWKMNVCEGERVVCRPFIIKSPIFLPFVPFVLRSGCLEGQTRTAITNGSLLIAQKNERKKKKNRLWAKTETLRTWGADGSCSSKNLETGVRKTENVNSSEGSKEFHRNNHKLTWLSHRAEWHTDRHPRNTIRRNVSKALTYSFKSWADFYQCRF